jgi:DHA1 family tetracycline resistance protein-like MFS transporter
MSEPQTEARRKAALSFIFVTVTIDMIALGVVIPVLPRLIEQFAGQARDAGWINGGFVGVWALMQFVCSPILGALSDRFGRRPVLLVSMIGLGLDYVLMALAPNLVWLLIGRIASGATSANATTAFAYIADVTPEEKRAGAFGMVGAAFGLGFILGPAIGGVLGDIAPRLPFWFATGLCLVNALYGFFILPESLPKDRRAPFAWRRANPVGSLALLRSHPELSGLAAVNFLAACAHAVLPSVFVLYAGHRFGWDAKTVGLTMGAIGVCSALVQAVVTGWSVKRFGERTTMVAGLASGAVGFAIYGLAPNGWIFAVGLPVMSLWGMAGPSAQALMTRLVAPTEQGQLQGANMSLAAIAGVISPLVFGFAYTLSVDLPGLGAGAPFYLASVLLLAGAAVAYRAGRKLAAQEGAIA